MKAPKQITLQYWTKADFEIVRNILLVTWKDAYYFIPEKDIIIHLKNYYSEAKLLEMFNNPNVKGIFAQVENASAGWMKLSDDSIADRFYISSLYVLPEFQGLGAGKKLLSRAEEIALKLNYKNVWLGVMKDNTKALDWYRKTGFKFVEEESFKMGETQVLHLIGYKPIS